MTRADMYGFFATHRVRRSRRLGDGPDATPRPRARRAFTLMEVLIALAIFGLTAVELGAAYLNLLQMHAALRARDTAEDEVRWARAAFLAEKDRALAERGGDVTLPDGRRAIWRSTIAPTNVSDLFDATLDIEIPPAAGGGENTRVTQTLRLLRPDWSTPAERDQLRLRAKQRLQRERLSQR